MSSFETVAKRKAILNPVPKQWISKDIPSYGSQSERAKIAIPLIWGILKYIIRYQCRGRFMSGSYINNNHHKKSSKIITINSFYCYCCYYCCCCCCCCCGGDDTYYWVYLSSDHPFQVYYKVRQVLLQVRQVLESATILLQSATGITKSDDYYKVRQNTS